MADEHRNDTTAHHQDGLELGRSIFVRHAAFAHPSSIASETVQRYTSFLGKTDGLTVARWSMGRFANSLPTFEWAQNVSAIRRQARGNIASHAVPRRKPMPELGETGGSRTFEVGTASDDSSQVRDSQPSQELATAFGATVVSPSAAPMQGVMRISGKLSRPVSGQSAGDLRKDGDDSGSEGRATEGQVQVRRSAASLEPQAADIAARSVHSGATTSTQNPKAITVSGPPIFRSGKSMRLRRSDAPAESERGGVALPENAAARVAAPTPQARELAADAASASGSIPETLARQQVTEEPARIASAASPQAMRLPREDQSGGTRTSQDAVGIPPGSRSHTLSSGARDGSDVTHHLPSSSPVPKAGTEAASGAIARATTPNAPEPGNLPGPATVQHRTAQALRAGESRANEFAEPRLPTEHAAPGPHTSRFSADVPPAPGAPSRARVKTSAASSTLPARHITEEMLHRTAAGAHAGATAIRSHPSALDTTTPSSSSQHEHPQSGGGSPASAVAHVTAGPEPVGQANVAAVHPPHASLDRAIASPSFASHSQPLGSEVSALIHGGELTNQRPTAQRGATDELPTRDSGAPSAAANLSVPGGKVTGAHADSGNAPAAGTVHVAPSFQNIPRPYATKTNAATPESSVSALNRASSPQHAATPQPHLSDRRMNRQLHSTAHPHTADLGEHTHAAADKTPAIGHSSTRHDRVIDAASATAGADGGPQPLSPRLPKHPRSTAENASPRASMLHRSATGNEISPAARPSFVHDPRVTGALRDHLQPAPPSGQVFAGASPAASDVRIDQKTARQSASSDEASEQSPASTTTRSSVGDRPQEFPSTRHVVRISPSPSASRVVTMHHAAQQTRMPSAGQVSAPQTALFRSAVPATAGAPIAAGLLAPGSQGPGPAATPSAAGKNADIAQLANRVYDMLVRRLSSERQRRGV